MLKPVVAVAVLSIAMPTTALASDGCTVMLCLAGNWRSISQCVPPVHKALRNLALGRALPACDFATAPTLAPLPSDDENSLAKDPPSVATVPLSQARLRLADADFCPAQYRSTVEQESRTDTLCAFAGAIEVTIGGRLWNRTWWSLDGDSVTEWTAAARAAMPEVAADDRFERDFEAWSTNHGPAPEPATEQPEGGV